MTSLCHSSLLTWTQHSDVSLHDDLQVSDKLASESAENAERTAELVNLTTEVAQHKETVAGQEMTSADARRMQDERKHLESEFVALQTQKDALSKQVRDEWRSEHCPVRFCGFPLQPFPTLP